jgi:glycosyltransferase involved in cell wall biosynthesis
LSPRLLAWATFHGRPRTWFLRDDSPEIVSVIVYCDGRESPLVRTLESLASQTLAEFEILIVGTPPSKEELGRIAPGLAHSDLRPVSLRPLPGPMSTTMRNEAIDAARGQFVIELSAGDWVETTALEKAAWALETTPQAGLVVIDEAKASQRHRYFGPLGVVGLAGGGIQPGKYALRVAAWREIDGFEVRAPASTADQDLLIRLVGRRWQAPMIPESLTHLHEPEPERDAATHGWLHSRHRGFYARATAARLVGGAAERIRPRIPFLAPVSRWIAWKVEVEGLTDRRRALRHPVDSALRFVPQPLKGRLWGRLKLPVRAEMWSYEPPQLDLPSTSRLRPIAPPAPGPRQARKTRLLVAHHYLTTGGAGAVVLNLLTRIDRDRFDVHLITTDYEPDRELKRPPLRRFAEQTDSIYQLPAFLGKDYFLRFLIDFINSRRIDVVLVSLSIFTYQALPQLRAACPDTAFLDLLHAEAPYGPMDHIRLASRYREFLDRRVVTTETVRAAQITKYGESADRVVVIPNGIDTTEAFNPSTCTRGAFRRELGIGADVAIVLYFGRMSLEKQPIHVVDAAERLRDRSDIAFVLLGEGPETLVVEKAISARGLTNVHLSRPRDDLRTVVADADVVIFPSKREGLPMAGIESMSMGKPIVASKVPGWVDLVTDGVEGFLIDDGDIAGYADAITRLLGDPVLYDRMSRAGREKATRAYDLGQSVRAWEELLSAMVGSRGRSSS